MIPELRHKFNSAFTEATYTAFIADIEKECNDSLVFRVCETPMFIAADLTAELVKAAEEIAASIQTSDFLNHVQNAIPSGLVVPNEDAHTMFMQVDFAICKDSSGKLIPQLIELQGFPSLFAFQEYLDVKIRQHFNIPSDFTPYFNGLNTKSYQSLFTKILTGGGDPNETVLLEIEPDKQKTRIDFLLTERMTGVKTLDLTHVIKRGKKLFYKDGSREVQIKRIYNRVIFDELDRKDLTLNFNLTDEADVTWVGHPNWFFKISKYALPLIKSKYAPPCYFLNELETYPADLENYVLKPLFSFAGAGVEVDVTKASLDAKTNRENYILQKKVAYAPLIQTPNGYSMAEVRMMFFWDTNDAKPTLVNNLLRTSKGKMMGVSFNKDKTWVGSSIAFHP
jgi:hypothetical protein